jgi:hypothetical protein
MLVGIALVTATTFLLDVLYTSHHNGFPVTN